MSNTSFLDKTIQEKHHTLFITTHIAANEYDFDFTSTHESSSIWSSVFCFRKFLQPSGKKKS
jgi:hypothetical protein